MRPAILSNSAPSAKPSTAGPAAQAAPSLPPKQTHAIVIFGRGLNRRTGKPTAALTRRLRQGLEDARADPNALIVVSGGAAHNRFPEADGMRDWLVKNGIPSGRILVEDHSMDTIDNAENVAQLLQGGKVKRVTVVTEQYHVHRAHDLLAHALSFRNLHARIDDSPAPDAYSGLSALKMAVSEERLLVLDRAKQAWRHLTSGHSFFG